VRTFLKYLNLIFDLIILFIYGIFFLFFILGYIYEGIERWTVRYIAFLKAEIDLIEFKFKNKYL
jgi:hypothetical protein